MEDSVKIIQAAMRQQSAVEALRSQRIRKCVCLEEQGRAELELDETKVREEHAKDCGCGEIHCRTEDSVKAIQASVRHQNAIGALMPQRIRKCVCLEEQGRAELELGETKVRAEHAKNCETKGRQQNPKSRHTRQTKTIPPPPKPRARKHAKLGPKMVIHKVSESTTPSSDEQQHVKNHEGAETEEKREEYFQSEELGLLVEHTINCTVFQALLVCREDEALDEARGEYAKDLIHDLVATCVLQVNTNEDEHERAAIEENSSKEEPSHLIARVTRGYLSRKINMSMRMHRAAEKERLRMKTINATTSALRGVDDLLARRRLRFHKVCAAATSTMSELSATPSSPPPPPRVPSELPMLRSSGMSPLLLMSSSSPSSRLRHAASPSPLRSHTAMTPLLTRASSGEGSLVAPSRSSSAMMMVAAPTSQKRELHSILSSTLNTRIATSRRMDREFQLPKLNTAAVTGKEQHSSSLKHLSGSRKVLPPLVATRMGPFRHLFPELHTQ